MLLTLTHKHATTDKEIYKHGCVHFHTITAMTGGCQKKAEGELDKTKMKRMEWRSERGSEEKEDNT